MLAEFFFALAMLWWEGLRALKIDIRGLVERGWLGVNGGLV